MQWSDIPFDPDRKTLRQFAGLWLVVLRRHGPLAGPGEAGILTLGLSLAALALMVGLAGLTRPEWVRSIFVGWMVLAFPIGWTVSQVIAAPDVLRPVHADRPGVPPHRPRRAPACPATGVGIVLGPQAGPGRLEELFQAILNEPWLHS